MPLSPTAFIAVTESVGVAGLTKGSCACGSARLSESSVAPTSTSFCPSSLSGIVTCGGEIEKIARKFRGYVIIQSMAYEYYQ